LYLSIRPFLSVLAFPLHIISNIFRFIFGVLRIPVPQLRFSALNFYRPLPRRPVSSGGPDRWVRELEEETGAVCIGRSNIPKAVSSSTATNGAGPSSLTARPRAFGEDRKLLPDFTLGSYDEALRICQKEVRIGCIILVSEEHDDVTEFKRYVLSINLSRVL
jgi:FAS-associated factor 2